MDYNTCRYLSRNGYSFKDSKFKRPKTNVIMSCDAQAGMAPNHNQATQTNTRAPFACVDGGVVVAAKKMKRTKQNKPNIYIYICLLWDLCFISEPLALDLIPSS
jgi:hypothetical protein